MDQEFTFENVEKVAQAFADFMGSGKRVVIGYDYRKNSENFAKVFAEILTSNGIETVLASEAGPTPSVSFTIVKEKFNAGIIITASHNPAGYNGIKIKNDFGGSAEKTITDAVEKLIGKNPVKKGKTNFVTRNLNDKFFDFLKAYLRLDAIKNAPFHILVDSMHGVGAKRIEELVAGGKIKVTTIRSERDLTFGGNAPEPIAKNLSKATELMKSGKYDLCVVTDGDADRVGAIRPGGEFVSPGIILSLIMKHFVEDLGRKGSVVTTISNTALIYKIARKLGLTVHETPVGFKYVCEIMRRENVLIGGEESGGIGFQDYLYERDGILSGLLLMEMMAMRNQSFDQILTGVEKEFGKLSYVRQDVDYPNELKAKLFDHLAKNKPTEFQGLRVKNIGTSDGTKFTLEDDSWLLFRLSGTEPILRIYAEATSKDLAEKLVAQGKSLAFSL